MRIAAMGAGGVGGYFGARLQQAGHEVAFFARGKHFAALKEKGLTLKSPLGAAQLAVQVFSDPAQTEPVDVVMFAVKLWDTESAAEQLRPVVGQHTVIIPFQNGVESIERLAKIFPREQILGGSAYIATRISAPGVIEHIGTMAGMEFGPLKPAQRAAAEAFLAACQGAGINAKLANQSASATVSDGQEAAVSLIELFKKTTSILSPVDVIGAYVEANHRVIKMWELLSDRTIRVVANGCLHLAMLWESAWIQGGGPGIADSKLKAIPKSKLRGYYQNPKFAPSMYLPDMIANGILAVPV